MDTRNENAVVAEIYEKYSEKVKSFFKCKINSQSMAEDLTSVVFTKVVKKIGSYDSSKAGISTWVFTIARNTLIDYYRSRKNIYNIEDYTYLEDTAQSYINNDALLGLSFALEKLEDLERQVIIFHYYHDKTLLDIAKKLGLTYAKIKIIHKKALAKLTDLCK